jgi:thiol:disulfide interchange protein DsbD
MNPVRLLLPLIACLALPAWAAEPLDPEQAYRYSVRAIDDHTVEARWDITDGYYMYREKFRFTAEPATVKLGDPVFPAGHVKNDEFFGKVETYRDSVAIRIPVEAGGATTFTLKAVSQGCWDEGICYPPTPQQAMADLTKIEAATPIATAAPLPSAAAAPAAEGDESSKISQLLKNGSFWLIIASFFGFGLLLSFTPCVFPMVPILSGIIVNHGHAVTHARAFWLSLAYVMGMAVTYAAVGVAAGFSPHCKTPGCWAVLRWCSSSCRCRCSASTNCNCPPRCKASFPRKPTGRAAASAPSPSWARCRR